MIMNIWNKVSKKEASNLFLYGPYQLQSVTIF